MKRNERTRTSLSVAQARLRLTERCLVGLRVYRSHEPADGPTDRLLCGACVCDVMRAFHFWMRSDGNHFFCMIYHVYLNKCIYIDR